jgi:hypothetical protein
MATINIGKHHIYFSEDRQHVSAHWENLTVDKGSTGISAWEKK